MGDKGECFAMALTDKRFYPLPLLRALFALLITPILTAALFFMPLKPLLFFFFFTSAIALPLLRVRTYFSILKPAFFYFLMLSLFPLINLLHSINTASFTSLIRCLISGTPLARDAVSKGYLSTFLSSVYGALTFSFSIASASLLCTLSYTLTTDIERREALYTAEYFIRSFFLRLLFSLHFRKKGNSIPPDPAIQPVIAPYLSLLSSFIPLILRTWQETKDALSARSTLSPALLALFHPLIAITSFLTVCLKKAIETQDAILSR